MAGCILLYSQTIIKGGHSFVCKMYNNQWSYKLECDLNDFLWHTGKMDVYVDIILKKQPPYK